MQHKSRNKSKITTPNKSSFISTSFLSIMACLLMASLSFGVSTSAQVLKKYPDVQLSSPDQILKDGGQIDNSRGSKNGLDINGSKCTNEYDRFDDPGYNTIYDPSNPDPFLYATAAAFNRCVTTNGNLASTLGKNGQLPREQALAIYQQEKAKCALITAENYKKRCYNVAINTFAEMTSTAFAKGLAPQTNGETYDKQCLNSNNEVIADRLCNTNTNTPRVAPAQNNATQNTPKPASNQGGGGFNLNSIGDIFSKFDLGKIFNGSNSAPAVDQNTTRNIGTQRQQNSGFAPNPQITNSNNTYKTPTIQKISPMYQPAVVDPNDIFDGSNYEPPTIYSQDSTNTAPKINKPKKTPAQAEYDTKLKNLFRNNRNIASSELDENGNPTGDIAYTPSDTCETDLIECSSNSGDTNSDGTSPDYGYGGYQTASNYDDGFNSNNNEDNPTVLTAYESDSNDGYTDMNFEESNYSGFSPNGDEAYSTVLTASEPDSNDGYTDMNFEESNYDDFSPNSNEDNSTVLTAFESDSNGNDANIFNNDSSDFI